MDLPRNLFKEGLKAGRQQIGLWLSIPSPGAAEAVATAGFDWLMIDTEHTPNSPASVMGDATEIKRLLDVGAQTILVPYVQSADEARAAVAAVLYPPLGMRGVAGLTRAGRYGAIPNYTARANDEICLLVQVETRAALGQIEEIAAIEGVDGVFIGPADLAASLGFPGQLGHPEVKATILQAIRRIVAAGKPAGILSSDEDFLREAMAAGTTFTAVGLDIGILVSGARALTATWKDEA